MSMSSGPPPAPEKYDDKDIPHARPRQSHTDHENAGPWDRTDKARVAAPPPLSTRRISPLGWGLGALVSIGLWVAIFYLVL